MKGAPGAGKVELARFQREARRVTLDEGDVARSELPCTLEQLRNDVAPHALADERCQRECERSGTGPAVEGALVSGRHDEGPELVANELDLPLGMLGDELGCVAEPRAHVVDVRLSHRRRLCGAPAAGPSRCHTRARS